MPSPLRRWVVSERGPSLDEQTLMPRAKRTAACGLQVQGEDPTVVGGMELPLLSNLADRWRRPSDIGLF